MVRSELMSYFNRLEQLWRNSRNTLPRVPYVEKIPDYMYRGEVTESGYIEWLPHALEMPVDFGKAETAVGFELHDALKEYFSSFFFLRLSGLIGEVEVDLTPITPLTDVEVFLTKRHLLALNTGRDPRLIEIGNATIEEADSWLIFFDNNTGEIKCLDPEKKSVITLSGSLVELFRSMDPLM